MFKKYSIMNETSPYTNEETAYEWLQRVQRNKRKLSLNPICFPFMKKGTAKETVDNDDTNNGIPSQFHVIDLNVARTSADTFLCRMNKVNELNCRAQRWRRRRRKTKTNANSLDDNLTNLEDLLLESFPRGIGMSFIDGILKTNANMFTSGNVKDTPTTTHNKDVALEIVGPTGTAKTKILMALASNYAAATSNRCLLLQESSSTRTPGMDKQFDYTSTHAIRAPTIFIFDPEFAVDTEGLIGLVRVAILRRWNATSEYRRCLRKVQMQTSECVENDHFDPDESVTTGNDYGDIETDIRNAFSRIHILRPRDIANGYVSALESIHQLLDKQNADACNGHIHGAPPLLLFDSMLSAFHLSNKMKENLGSGISGMNCFLRQLRRLRSKHSVIIASTRTISSSGATSRQLRSNCDGWNKITSHRLVVMKCVGGSPEDKDGHDFVAILKPQHDPRNTLNVDEKIHPFYFTSNGIMCRSNV